MRQFVLYVLLLSVSYICAETEPDSFSQEGQERKKYLDPGLGVQNNFFDASLTQEFCEFILSTAPREIVEKIKLMTNPFCPVEIRPKRIILVGPSGSGKTTIAQVIGLLSFRPVVYINAGMLGNEFKNSAAQNLRRAIEPYIHTSCVVILDEIDCLLKQSQHDRNPDADLPKQIWEIFDICSQFPNITLICITNDISGMPEPLKTRLAGDIIEVPLIDSLEHRKAILEFHLNQTPHTCDDVALNSIVQTTKALSHRELAKIIKEAYAGAFLRDQMLPKIKIDDLEKAFQKVQKNRKLLNKINWKDYEKHFQYGIQISGVFVSCIGVAAATYMAALSLKVSKDAYEVSVKSHEYNKKHGKKGLEQGKEQHKSNQALTRELAYLNFRTTLEGQFRQDIYAVMHTFWQHNKDGGGYLALDYMAVADPNSWTGASRELTPISKAAKKLFSDGWARLGRWGEEGFDKMVEEEFERRLKNKK